ncbi:TRAM/LAG1/CLN8 homology domain-containing protein [Kickxella alabastrina]|uniref:TRAM/LAG1/CLN8 homology domain-containing protein n=1 Tax=Kickxella alabastrina TaxID=61397 RepID=UPI0022209989|nr:TRAM/LAG1/CLN8 homology domain-containing protein [Kickxella alabastrina]KAI7829187.1 TRAM/LAG1/CLN8 homology domain-containing protein [Kickxella alabastrina]
MVTRVLVIISNSKLRSNPLHGFDQVAETVYSVTVGYFLWDIIDTYKNIDINGIGFMAHAVMSFGVYLLSYTPLLQYYGACFMMFEVSTIFLNFHFFLEDLGLQDAIMYLINGIALVSSFFFARVVYGTIISINVWKLIANSEIPINPFVANFIRYPTSRSWASATTGLA